jgi:hypothetical protein
LGCLACVLAIILNMRQFEQKAARPNGRFFCAKIAERSSKE